MKIIDLIIIHNNLRFIFPINLHLIIIANPKKFTNLLNRFLDYVMGIFILNFFLKKGKTMNQF